jgi:hypothetical protein
MSRWNPSLGQGVRDPRDAGKRNGMFFNPVRYLYFGGAPGAPMQAGSKMPGKIRAADSQNAIAPISDRGRGRR